MFVRQFFAVAAGVLLSFTAAWGEDFTANAKPSDLKANTLPFSLSITEEPFINQPDYFGGGQGNPYAAADFPVCPVLIDGEIWVIYMLGEENTPVYRWKGTNLENGKRQPDGHASFPVKRPYMLGGMWYDDVEKKLYAPLHCEYYDEHGSLQMQRQIHLATSTDKGLTWHYEGAIVTRDRPDGVQPTTYDYSGVYMDGGAGDFLIYVDSRGGYVYLYTGAYIWPKQGVQKYASCQSGFLRHCVARCAIHDKMMPGKWHKFYNGSWDEPGLGGKASFVNVYYVMYNTYLKKYLGFDYGGGLAVCSDLSKQDWTPTFKIKEGRWGCKVKTDWAWHVTDADKNDIFTGGQTLFLYTYWKADGKQAQTRRYRLQLGQGILSDDNGYAPLATAFRPIISMDPTTLYPCEPLYESADPLESRRTRQVSCASTENCYAGTWSEVKNAGPGGKPVRTSEKPDSEIRFSFRGADVYWRTLKGPTCGKADVFIDGVFQKTADCYASDDTPDQFAFIKTGLAANSTHTIRVVVRGEKCPLSTGTAIRHLFFEYSAESYRASDGYSAVNGKNQWQYQEKRDNAYANATFVRPKWGGKKHTSDCVPKWVGKKHTSDCVPGEIQCDSMIPHDSEVVRKWTAPHAGTARIEGSLLLDGKGDGGIQTSILKNDKNAWTSRLTSAAKQAAHDFTISVNEGESLYFIAKGIGEKSNSEVVWDPVITYVFP